MIHVKHWLAAALLAAVGAAVAAAPDTAPIAKPGKPAKPYTRQNGYWHLLEPSGHPATAEDCQRAQPQRGRPDFIVNLQHRANHPYHRRACWWRLMK